MRESAILKTFFQDHFGSDYRIEEFRNAVSDYAPSTEVMRLVKSTDEIIAETIGEKAVRGIIRTSQSDYIGLMYADGASFTWSLEIAAPIDKDVDTDIERIRKMWTERIVPVVYGAVNYEMLLAFAMPAKFTASTINGVDYQQIVWGGKATLVEKSELANEYGFYVNGIKIPNVLSFSLGYTLIGENYNTERAGNQQTAGQTFTNGAGLSIHASKNEPVIQNMIAVALGGSITKFTLTVKRGTETVSEWTALYSQVNVQGSLGSFVLVDVQIIRS